eukprot:5397106-Amphidinium_carterae.1
MSKVGNCFGLCCSEASAPHRPTRRKSGPSEAAHKPHQIAVSFMHTSFGCNTLSPHQGRQQSFDNHLIWTVLRPVVSQVFCCLESGGKPELFPFGSLGCNLPWAGDSLCITGPYYTDFISQLVHGSALA